MTDVLEIMARVIDDAFTDVIESEDAQIRRIYARKCGPNILSALDAAGYAVVPKEPTQAMLDAVVAAEQHEPFSDATMSDVYRAMIAASK